MKCFDGARHRRLCQQPSPSVSGRVRLDEALLATGTPFNRNDKETCDLFMDQMRSVMQKTAGIRRYGAAALDLAYVAAGRYDGFWENGLEPWDVAAGLLLVREAGGFVTNLKANDTISGSQYPGDERWTPSQAHGSPRARHLLNRTYDLRLSVVAADALRYL